MNKSTKIEISNSFYTATSVLVCILNSVACFVVVVTWLVLVCWCCYWCGLQSVIERINKLLVNVLRFFSLLASCSSLSLPLAASASASVPVSHFLTDCSLDRSLVSLLDYQPLCYPNTHTCLFVCTINLNKLELCVLGEKQQ